MNRRRFLRESTLGVAALTLPDTIRAESRSPQSSLVRVAPSTEENTLSLSGEWAYLQNKTTAGELEGWKTQTVFPKSDGWGVLRLPGCLERDLPDAHFNGTTFYRRDILLPDNWRGAQTRIWWEQDAVSYHAVGWVGGEEVGTHTGLWDAFMWEVPKSAIRPDGTAQLALAVEKPGNRSYPLRETLAGFLPSIWGTWGGSWQESRLRFTGAASLQNLWARGTGNGTVQIRINLDAIPGTQTALEFVVQDADGKIIVRKQSVEPDSRQVETTLTVPKPIRWEPAQPALYTITVTARVGGRVSDRRTRRFGFRDVSVRDDTILLNGKPILFRAPVSWGWYPETGAPNPASQTIEEELRRVVSLGFNGVQLAYWIPPQRYFEIADAMGILLWLVLPLYHTHDSEFFHRQTNDEITRIAQQIGDHPSVILWTIPGGTEATKPIAGTTLLPPLSEIIRKQSSGLVYQRGDSGELRQGGMNTLSPGTDFGQYDVHTEPMFLRPILDTLTPQWRTKKPFFLGDFCDQDSFRDLPAFIAKSGGKIPWWAKPDTRQNSSEIKPNQDVAAQIERMTQNDLLGRAAELRESSRKQALLTRKIGIEQARSYPFVSGYGVAGLSDTPISTSGIVDDFNHLRFTAEEFTPFNGDTVLFIETDRRFATKSGGDRPLFLDRYGAAAGQPVRRHIGVSHYGTEFEPALLRWTVTDRTGKTIARGEFSVKQLIPGSCAELGDLEFAAPRVQKPERISITAELRFERGRVVVNSWHLWIYPTPVPGERRQIALFDPGEHLEGFSDAVGLIPIKPPSALAPTDSTPGENRRAPVMVATTFRPAMLGYVRGGAKLLLLQTSAGDGFPAVHLPFWRGALRLVDEHPSWGDFPHERGTDIPFYGLASDLAFDNAELKTALGNDATIMPILTRVDARDFAMHSYSVLVQIGRGTMLLTTLRPQGGMGDQPSGVTHHIGGAYLLRNWLDWLEGFGESL